MIDKIKAIIAVPEVGEIYNGLVKSITPFGAFVEVLPGVEALLPQSALAELQNALQVPVIIVQSNGVDIFNSIIEMEK